MNKTFLLLWVAMLPAGLLAQPVENCSTKRTLDTYFSCEMKNRAAQMIRHPTLLDTAARDLKIRDSSNQSEPLSLLDNSTSLADTTAASDIASVSTTLSAFSSKSRTPNSTDVNSTFSAYAIYAMLRQTSPLDPALFARKAALRALSFTYADSFPSDKGATADQGSRAYGAKYLIYGGRDLSSCVNSKKKDEVVDNLKKTIAPSANAIEQMSDFLFTTFGADFAPGDRSLFEKKLQDQDGSDSFRAMLGRLGPEDRQKVDSMINQAVQSEVNLEKVSIAVANEVVHASQLSAGFSAKISKGNDKNTYRSEFIHDKQFTDWFKETLNVGWDFQNAQKATAKNRQIGRVALQGETAFTHLSGKPFRIPLSLIYGGEGDWGTNGTPIYKAQLKLKITIFPGIDVPLVGSYANRAGNVARADLKGQVNLSFDFAKILKGVKKTAS